MFRTLMLAIAAAMVFGSFASGQLLEEEVRPTGLEESDRFGFSLDADAGRFVSGAIYDGFPGAAYVFHYAGGHWIEESKLAPTDGGVMDQFGYDVAIQGDTVVIGSPNHDQPNGVAGAAYIYRWTGAGWGLDQKLLAGIPSHAANFGGHVAIHGDRIAVAARLEDLGGAVYVFELIGTTWTQTARIEPNGLQNDDYFGSDVALQGDTLVAGAFGTNGTGGGDLTGVAYVYRELGGVWTPEAVLPGPNSGEANFGFAVSLDGDRVAIGAPSQCCSAPLEGAVYVYERVGTSWMLSTELRAPGGLPAERFGYAVSLDGNRLLVGAKGEDLVADQSGAVYLFHYDGAAWSPGLRWTGLETGDSDIYGTSVTLDGPRLLAGASGVDEPNAGGAVYSVELGSDAIFYCFCENDAPCGNGVGFGGCATGSGAGGLLLGYGTASVTDDELVLRVFDAEPGQYGLVMVGRARQQVPYGDGQLCIAPGVGISFVHFPLRLSDDTGVFTEGPGLVAYSQTNFPPVYQFRPGETYTFQGRFRTRHTSSCGTFFNATNAVAVTFQP